MKNRLKKAYSFRAYDDVAKMLKEVSRHLGKNRSDTIAELVKDRHDHMKHTKAAKKTPLKQRIAQLKADKAHS